MMCELGPRGDRETRTMCGFGGEEEEGCFPFRTVEQLFNSILLLESPTLWYRVQKLIQAHFICFLSAHCKNFISYKCSYILV